MLDTPVQLYPRRGGHGNGNSSGNSPAAEHGASSTFLSSSGNKPFAISSERTATAYSDGGGKPYTLGSDSIFSGRTAGGGTRNDVYGTSLFGSGYPYGGSDVYVTNRPLPFVFFPVPLGQHYYGGDNYLDDNNRPGGNLVMALISSEVATTQEIYRIVADNSSVISVFQALVSNCSVTNSSDISPYYPSNNTWPLPEQVVQYYRASSFALSLDSYNNTAALASNAPMTNTSTPKSVPVSPLPNSINNTFLVCLNTTVGASIPLVDPISKDDLYEIIGAAAFVGIIVLIILYNYCVDKADSTDEDVEDARRKRVGPTFRSPYVRGSSNTDSQPNRAFGGYRRMAIAAML